MSRLEELKAEKARREQERTQEPSAYPEKQGPTTSLDVGQVPTVDPTAPAPSPTPIPQAPAAPQPASRLEALKQERDRRNANRTVIQEMHPDAYPYRGEIKRYLDRPDQFAAALKQKLPQHDVQVIDGQVVIRRQDEPNYKVLDPAFLSGGIKEFGKDVLDFGYDIGTLPATIGATAAGAAAGSLAGPVGAVVGGALGAGLSEGAVETGRQTIAQKKNFRQEYDESQIALATALGTVAGPVVGAVAGAGKAAGRSIYRGMLSLFPKKGSFVNRQVQKTIGIKLNNLSKLATRAEKDANNVAGDHLQTAVNNIRDTAQKTRIINGKQTNLLSGSAQKRTQKIQASVKQTRNEMKDLFKNMEKMDGASFSPKIVTRINKALNPKSYKGVTYSTDAKIVNRMIQDSVDQAAGATFNKKTIDNLRPDQIYSLIKNIRGSAFVDEKLSHRAKDMLIQTSDELLADYKAALRGLEATGDLPPGIAAQLDALDLELYTLDIMNKAIKKKAAGTFITPDKGELDSAVTGMASVFGYQMGGYALSLIASIVAGSGIGALSDVFSRTVAQRGAPAIAREAAKRGLLRKGFSAAGQAAQIQTAREIRNAYSDPKTRDFSFRVGNEAQASTLPIDQGLDQGAREENIEKLNPVLRKKARMANAIYDTLKTSAEENELPESAIPIMLRMINAESNFNPVIGRTEPTGETSIGLGQMMPKTAIDLGFKPEDRFDPTKSAEMTAAYFGKLYKEAKQVIAQSPLKGKAKQWHAFALTAMSYNGGGSYMSQDTLKRLIKGTRSTYRPKGKPDPREHTPWYLPKVFYGLVELSKEQSKSREIARLAGKGEADQKILKDYKANMKPIMEALGINMSQLKQMLNSKADY